MGRCTPGQASGKHFPPGQRRLERQHGHSRKQCAWRNNKSTTTVASHWTSASVVECDYGQAEHVVSHWISVSQGQLQRTVKQHRGRRVSGPSALMASKLQLQDLSPRLSLSLCLSIAGPMSLTSTRTTLMSRWNICHRVSGPLALFVDYQPPHRLQSGQWTAVGNYKQLRQPRWALQRTAKLNNSHWVSGPSALMTSKLHPQDLSVHLSLSLCLSIAGPMSLTSTRTTLMSRWDTGHWVSGPLALFVSNQRPHRLQSGQWTTIGNYKQLQRLHSTQQRAAKQDDCHWVSGPLALVVGYQLLHRLQSGQWTTVSDHHKQVQRLRSTPLRTAKQYNGHWVSGPPARTAKCLLLHQLQSGWQITIDKHQSLQCRINAWMDHHWSPHRLQLDQWTTRINYFLLPSSVNGKKRTNVIVCRLLGHIILGQPSNSRTTLSVNNDLRLQVRRLHAGQGKHPSLSVRTVTHKHTGSMETSITYRLQELTVMRWPSNSRITLSVQVDPRLQTSRLVNGQHKRPSFSAKTVKHVKSHQVAVQARQAMSASGQVMDFNHRRLQRRLAPNQKARTRQAG